MGRILGARWSIPLRPPGHIRGASSHPRCSRARGTHRERGRPETLAAAPRRTDRSCSSEPLGSTAMIARYTRPEIGAVWTDEARFGAMRDVEVAAAEALDGPT